MTSNVAAVYKRLYRKKIRTVLLRLTPHDQKKQSDAVCRQIIRDPDFRKAKAVCVYSALPSEVQTRMLMKSVIRSNRKLFLPRVQSKTRSLDIFEVRNLSRDLKSGSFDILEPDPVRCRQAHPDEVDLWIIPGIAFDLQGRRLGRGAGYFDRFFEKLPKARKWGLAYRVQMLPQIPIEDHDVHVDRVIAGGR